MNLEWDPKKAKENLRKHRVAFATAARFEFDTAFIGIDDDIAYGEERLKAYGFIGDWLHVMIYVERGDTLRIISLRKASRKEIDVYEEYFVKGW